MSFVQRILGVAPEVERDATDDRWWMDGGWGAQTSSGVKINPDFAMTLSAVFACVRLISETVGALPLPVYERLANGGRERATKNPLYRVLHDRPAQHITRPEFVGFMMAHVLLRGNGYAQIIEPTREYPLMQLKPIHPDRVAIEKTANGQRRYRVMDESGRSQVLLPDEMFHLRGLSLDGETGMSVIAYARETMGLASAAESYGGRFFGNGSRPSGILRTDGKLSETAAKRLRDQWSALHGGKNSHKTAVLEEGLSWQQVSIAPEDAQFLETREFQANEVARWFGVPPHMIGLVSGSTSWGTGIVEMSLGFVTYTLLPWLRRFEQAISRDLIIADQKYYAEFETAALVAGDIEGRYGAYAIGRQWGFLSINDVRRRENMNPVPGGDEYMVPFNMRPATRVDGVPDAVAAHYRMLARESAARVVRKEVAALNRLATKTQGYADWSNGVDEFYATHGQFVAEALCIDIEGANGYATQRRDDAALMVDGFDERQWQGGGERALMALMGVDDE